jgi:hypothetical protein
MVKRVRVPTFTESNGIFTFFGLCTAHTRQVYFASVYCSAPKWYVFHVYDLSGIQLVNEVSVVTRPMVFAVEES